MSRLKTAQNYFMSEPKAATLDDLLENISVLPCDDMVDDFEPDEPMGKLNAILSGWYAVANHEGIIAYFGTEAEAYHYRLDFINRILNS